MLQYLVFIGATINLLGHLSYVKETLKGNTKPNKVTWLIWSIAPLIATFAAISSGVRWAVLPVFTAGLCPLLVFLSSFVNPKSFWELEKWDYICGVCSALALILWGITHNPNIAIIFAIISDGFAGTPTIIKSWRHPKTESAGAYIAGLFNALTSFSALKILSFAELAFPIFLVIEYTFLSVAAYHHKFEKKSG
jgi:hypothetical protein